ncbi:MAG TPA: hypothetical protein DCO75_11420 [Fibrobacteres bacterium]|nr:hypothetical protein [Fibrobacterota bacterium]
MIKKPISGHSWRFFRAGGFDQVRIDTAADMLALDSLDQKLWVALACPVDNICFDERTLKLIDTDNDGRIRPAELINAIKWTSSLLCNKDDIIFQSASFTLNSINVSSEEGKNIASAMKSALDALGKKTDDSLTVTEVESLEKIIYARPFNGDGVITESSSSDENLRMIIRNMISALGFVTDRSGESGINLEKTDTYFGLAKKFDAWMAESENSEAISPLKGETDGSAKALKAVMEKIDDYFTRCAVADFDKRAAAILDDNEKQYEMINSGTISLKDSELVSLPVAHISPDGKLPLAYGINPAWNNALCEFSSTVVKPLLGEKATISESEWLSIKNTFTQWFSWLERKPADIFDFADAAAIRKIVSGGYYEVLLGLLEKDNAETATFTSIINLEKLIRFRRDLHRLCTNFVNFKDFYSMGGKALFQAGTLYLDQRSCTLCIKINDINKHAAMSATAGTYLVYCECRRNSGETMNIVAAVTNGDSEQLTIGRNGVFYDRSGKDWDATIVRIIENPISLRQSFWLPYKSFVRMIESQVARRATTAGAQTNNNLQHTAETAANIDKTRIDPPKKLDIGIVAALGVAAGALGTFVATLLGYISGIIKMGPIAVIFALLVLLLVISGPSLILAYIKLRKRNIGPILDAAGWAINAKARINVPFGSVLTGTAVLPQGAQRDMIDPYAEKKSIWPKIIMAAIIIYIAYAALDHIGIINTWTKGLIGKKQKTTVTSMYNVPQKNQYTFQIERKEP